MGLFLPFIGDVGACRVYKAIGLTRQDLEMWKGNFQVCVGVPLRKLPAFRVAELNLYHSETQRFATSCRGMDDVTRAAFEALIDGCCAPFQSVA